MPDAEEQDSRAMESPETLSRMATHPDASIRARAAQSTHTPPDILARLADDPDREVRTHVAKNPNATPEILARLATAKNSDYYLLEWVAMHPNTPLETLDILARRSHYSEWQIRVGVACNPKTPAHLLSLLAGDDIDWVRYYVREHPNTPPDARERLAGDPLPEGFQRFLED